MPNEDVLKIHQSSDWFYTRLKVIKLGFKVPIIRNFIMLSQNFINLRVNMLRLKTEYKLRQFIYVRSLSILYINIFINMNTDAFLPNLRLFSA
jgi:hypothetical protein